VGRPQCWAVGTGSTNNSSVFSALSTWTRPLTLNNNILAWLLVPLAVATGLVGQAIAFVVEGLAALTPWDMLSQLALDMQGSVRRLTQWVEAQLTSIKTFQPWCTARVAAQGPLLRTCLMSSDCCTFDTTSRGEGGSSSSSGATTSGSQLLPAEGLGGGDGTATVPPFMIQVWFTARLRENWPM